MISILLTGGAGYIGTETLRALQARNYRVYVIDNLYRGFVSDLHSENFFKIDLCDSVALRDFFTQNKIDMVVHLAALALIEESNREPQKYLYNNVTSTENLLNCCRDFEIKKFIFSSSCTIFGNSNPGVKLLSEKHNISPINPYGNSKLICEKLIQEWAEQTGGDYLILRYFNVAGANIELQSGQKTLEKHHLLHVLSHVAVKREKFFINGSDYKTHDGTCVRDFIHVLDVADIHEKAVEYLSTHSNGHTLNCGYGQAYSVKQISEIFQSVNALELSVEIGPRRRGDPDELVCDPTLLTKLLSWKSRYSQPIEEICRTAYLWQVQWSQKSTSSRS